MSDLSNQPQSAQSEPVAHSGVATAEAVGHGLVAIRVADARRDGSLLNSDQAALHLELLGIPADLAYFRAIKWDGSAAQDLGPVPGTTFEARLPHLIAAQGQSKRLYLIAGGAGDDRSVKACPAAFAEWDGVSWQEAWSRVEAVRASGLPTPVLGLNTWEGGSLHVWWRLDQPCTDIPRWTRFMERFVVVLGSDAVCRNPSRLMRLAGSSYIATDKVAKRFGDPELKGQIIGQTAVVWEGRDASGTPITCRLEQLEAWVDAQVAANPALEDLIAGLQSGTKLYGSAPRDGEVGPPTEDERKAARAAEGRPYLPPRTLAEINAALAVVPRRVSGLPEGSPYRYPYHRLVLCGLTDALYRLHGDEGRACDEAIGLMEEHSPSASCGWDIPQVLRSSGWLNEGVFWARARAEGWAGAGDGLGLSQNGHGGAGGQDALHQQLERAQAAVDAHLADALPVDQILDRIAATNPDLKWPDPAIHPVIASLVAITAARVGADGDDRNLVPLRDAITAKTKAPAGHIKSEIRRGVSECQQKYAPLVAAVCRLQRLIDAPRVEAARNARINAATAQVEGVCGGVALLVAVGSGWQDTDNGRKRTDLVKGDLAATLRQVLGRRLQFDDLALAPTIDKISIPAEQIEDLHVGLSEAGWSISKESSTDALIAASRHSRFHPVQVYLETVEGDPTIEPLPWDEFYAFYGVTDPLQQLYLRLLLLGLVNRALEPGCEFQTMTVLQSDQQGLGKTRSLKALVGAEWHNDTHQDSDKDRLVVMHQHWLYEFAELETITSRKEAGALKALISASKDSFRPPYGRVSQSFPRRFALVGTCNRRDFLVDDTGNRRFLIVEITRHIDVEAIAANRDRIWKAALIAYRNDESTWLLDDQLAANEAANEQFHGEHPWTALLQRWLEGFAETVPDGRGDTRLELIRAPDEFSTVEAILGARCVREGATTSAHARIIAPLLKRLGFEQYRPVIDGQKLRLWRRMDADGDQGPEPGPAAAHGPDVDRFSGGLSGPVETRVGSGTLPLRPDGPDDLSKVLKNEGGIGSVVRGGGCALPEGSIGGAFMRSDLVIQSSPFIPAGLGGPDIRTGPVQDHMDSIESGPGPVQTHLERIEAALEQLKANASAPGVLRDVVRVTGLPAAVCSATLARIKRAEEADNSPLLDGL
ncbi:VapE domain-containing protein [Synechococcus sp. 1G10]|uniref:VapE domain-containing protein n=1 Tax=Synechococcus sp. 1G10 TaxID=2025605 RepID=UPI001303137A|nr:VapE domain-containing protein [Synechococcus sp. 1G10]